MDRDLAVEFWLCTDGNNKPHLGLDDIRGPGTRFIVPYTKRERLDGI